MAFTAEIFAARSLAVMQAAPDLPLMQHIPLPKVDGRMDHMGIDLACQRLFAAAFDNHTLSAIDLKAGRQISLIPNLDKPQAAYYDAATNHLFVSASGDGSVKMFGGKTFQLLQTIKYSADADNFRYDAKNKHVIVGYGGKSSFMAHPESFQLEQVGPVSSSMSRTRRKFRWPTLRPGKPSRIGR